MQKINVISIHPLSELIQKIKNVRMLTDTEAQPYKDAEIKGISTLVAEQLSPCQLYVLVDEYKKVHKLRHLMLDQHGIDILRLGHSFLSGIQPINVDDILNSDDDVDLAGQGKQPVGYVVFSVDDDPTPITILPPIIETSFEADNIDRLIINDGMHRCYLARVIGLKPDVIVVKNVSKKHPYYAYPLPGGWNDVALVSDLSNVPLKKFHRLPEPLYKSMYRDFNSAFENVGGPRGK